MFHFLLLKTFTHLQLVQRLKIIAALTVTAAYLHGADRESFTGTLLFIFVAPVAFVPPV